MDFLYDESGNAYSFVYNGTQYYYVRNLQGDVVKILNTSGAVVASYTYDAWGKVSNSGNIVGLYNPIRYRGYYYDTDTGFYYLQSRYYDPAIKRFINADGYINANGDILGFNMYAYCGNDPINHIDKTGTNSEVVRQTLPLLPLLPFIDGPLPIGDILFGGIVILSIAVTYPNSRLENLEKIKDKIQAEAKTEEKTIAIDRAQTDSDYNYWEADLTKSKVVVIGNPLTVEEASLRVSQGGSIICRTQAAAKHIIYRNGYVNAVGPESHRGGFLHYHPTRNHTGYPSIHIWYIFP